MSAAFLGQYHKMNPQEKYLTLIIKREKGNVHIGVYWAWISNKYPVVTTQKTYM
jgi:hypothetical protein